MSDLWIHLSNLEVITSNKTDTSHVLVAVLYAVCAVSLLQVTGRSVGVENTQVLWTINACKGTTIITFLKDQIHLRHLVI